MIKVFSRTNCFKCKLTKRFLKENGLDFEEHNVDNEPEQLQYLKDNNLLSLPVVQTEAETWMGFNPKKLHEFANQVNAQ